MASWPCCQFRFWFWLWFKAKLGDGNADDEAETDGELTGVEALELKWLAALRCGLWWRTVMLIMVLNLSLFVFLSCC